MKKITTIIYLLAVATMLAACSDAGGRNPQMATISGVWNRQGVNEVSLFYTISGRMEKMATYQLQDDRQFAFAFMPPEEGFYVIGTGTSDSRKSKYAFYFKPGDNAAVEVNDTTYVLTGKNTKENEAMAAWHNYSYPLEVNSIYRTSKTYVDFFPLLEEKTAVEYKAAPTGNATFDKAFAYFRKFDILSYACTFVMSPRAAHPEGADFTDYYRNIKFDDIASNTAMLSYPFAAHFPTELFYVINRVKGPIVAPNINDMVEVMSNDTIKGEVFLEYLNMVRDYAVFEELMQEYERYILTDDQKVRLEKASTRIAAIQNETGVGKPAINFTHKDVNGKTVSLSDFKGKVVYVDVWATWCGPCRKELPHLKEIEQKYKGKDIVFIGVSIDEAKDQQKWKDFLVKEEMPGVQLFGGNGWNSGIAKLYQVKSIPRFLLFDKKGNVVSIDAPRPSQPELPVLLNKLLKQ